MQDETDRVPVDDDDGGLILRADVDVQSVVGVDLDDDSDESAYGHDLGADRKAVHHFLLLFLSLFLRNDGEEDHTDEDNGKDHPDHPLRETTGTFIGEQYKIEH